MTGWGVEGLAVFRGPRALLEGVSLGFRPGAVTNVIGPNGSGKTTLLRVLAGLERPSQGRVVGASDRWREPDWARKVACVLGPSSGELPFCVEEVLLSSQYPDGGRWVDPSPGRRASLVELLERLEVFAEGAHSGLERSYSTLSAGERQLVDIARGVLQRAPVLLLDEPTAALDLRHRLLIQTLLAEEALRGRTIVVTLHDLAHLPDGDVAVLNRGRLVAHGGAEVLTPALLASVWGVVPGDRDYQLV